MTLNSQLEAPVHFESESANKKNLKNKLAKNQKWPAHDRKTPHFPQNHMDFAILYGSFEFFEDDHIK